MLMQIPRNKHSKVLSGANSDMTTIRVSSVAAAIIDALGNSINNFNFFIIRYNNVAAANRTAVGAVNPSNTARTIGPATVRLLADKYRIARPRQSHNQHISGYCGFLVQ